MHPLVETFFQIAQDLPGQTAIKVQDQSITYDQLAQSISRLSWWLNKQGLLKGDRVGIHYPNSIEYVILYYACWLSGLVPVALNTFSSRREVDFWLMDSGCKVLFSNKFTNIDRDIKLYTLVYFENNLKIDDHVIEAEIQKTGGKRVSLNDIATIIYTSGTTGNPKGITLSHNNLASNVYAIIDSLEITSRDVFLCVLPFFYSFGNSILHTHLVSGASLILLNNVMYPALILKTIQQDKCNGFAGVPSLYISLIKKTDFNQFDLSSLRYMTQAGGPLASNLISRVRKLLPSVDFMVMYGQTEASARITCLPPNLLEKKPGSVGVAIKGIEIAIMDENTEPCAVNTNGEICVRGENIMQGYWGNEEATQRVIIDSWLHTGDMGYLDQDGFLYIQGRQSEILKISEHRVSPYEIEEVLLGHPSIDECAVIGCLSNQSGQYVRAYIVSNSSVIEDKQVKRYCKQYLASYKIPKEIIYVPSLPKTTSGKVQRNQLAC